jgi:hypothetical protein
MTTFQGSLQTSNNLAEIAANGMAAKMASVANLGITSAINGAASGYVMPVLNSMSANNAPSGWSAYNSTTTNVPSTYGILNTVSTTGVNVPEDYIWIYQTAYPTTYPFFPYVRTSINGAGWTPWVSVAGNQNGAFFVSGAITLTSVNLGQLIECTGTGYTVTVPSPSASPGSTLTFWMNTNGGTIALYTPYGSFDGPGGTGKDNFYITSNSGSVFTLFCDGYNWVVPSTGVEEDTTWQDMGYTYGTTYTNTFGRPITLYLNGTSTVAPYQYYVVIDGVTFYVGNNNTTTSYTAWTMVIPIGSTFYFNVNGGGTPYGYTTYIL